MGMGVVGSGCQPSLCASATPRVSLCHTKVATYYFVMFESWLQSSTVVSSVTKNISIEKLEIF